MKKRIISAALALLLLVSLAGCFTGCRGTKTLPEPDYSDFVFPEDTGRLTVYADDQALGALMDPAVELFRERFPETEVSYKILDADTYKTTVREEIDAGGGPDLVLFSSNTFMDIYKSMREGRFEDLNPYFAADEDLDPGDFIGPVMDGGIQNGRRFVVPLSYEMPLLMTTRSILKELDMTADEASSCEGFLDAAVRFHEAHPKGDLTLDLLGGFPPEKAYIRAMYLNLGFHFIDYGTGKVTIDEELFHRCMDIVKLYYDPEYDVSDLSKEEIDDGMYYQGGGLYKKQCLFDPTCISSYASYRFATSYLNGKSVGTVLSVQKNQYGGVTAELGICAAVPAGSPNKAAAWELLKILLSDEIQGGHDENRYDLSYLWSGFPVRRASIESSLTASALDAEAEKEETIPLSLITREEYIELVQSPTDASMVPNMYRRLIDEEIMPYIRDEKTWNQCYKSLVKALKSYMKS